MAGSSQAMTTEGRMVIHLFCYGHLVLQPGNSVTYFVMLPWPACRLEHGVSKEVVAMGSTIEFLPRAVR